MAGVSNLKWNLTSLATPESARVDLQSAITSIKWNEEVTVMIT